MNVTEKLLRVFRVDQQLAGLTSRLQGAERFLAEQTRQMEQIEANLSALAGQVRQLSATAADHEGEMKRLDERMAHLREQMNNAKTNKEYKAFLTEVNTLKADRDVAEQAALEHLTKLDEVKKQVAALEAQREERAKVKRVAAEDRDRKADEIRGRVAELQAERDRLAAEVPKDAMALYRELVRQHGDDAMAPLEEQDRRRHEYSCGSCQISLPVEAVNALLRGGAPTRCVSCGCLLYIEKELAESLMAATSKR